MSEKKEVIRCERCNEVLKPNKAVWLELSNTDGMYYHHEVPKGHVSQGGFSFGSTCAKKQIEEQ
jgi:hypothetical protein